MGDETFYRDDLQLGKERLSIVNWSWVDISKWNLWIKRYQKGLKKKGKPVNLYSGKVETEAFRVLLYTNDDKARDSERKGRE